jgi:uncharacterized protein YjeT (DUF2065 family)
MDLPTGRYPTEMVIEGLTRLLLDRGIWGTCPGMWHRMYSDMFLFPDFIFDIVVCAYVGLPL